MNKLIHNSRWHYNLGIQRVLNIAGCLLCGRTPSMQARQDSYQPRNLIRRILNRKKGPELEEGGPRYVQSCKEDRDLLQQEVFGLTRLATDYYRGPDHLPDIFHGFERTGKKHEFIDLNDHMSLVSLLTRWISNLEKETDHLMNTVLLRGTNNHTLLHIFKAIPPEGWTLHAAFGDAIPELTSRGFRLESNAQQADADWSGSDAKHPHALPVIPPYREWADVLPLQRVSAFLQSLMDSARVLDTFCESGGISHDAKAGLNGILTGKNLRTQLRLQVMAEGFECLMASIWYKAFSAIHKCGVFQDTSKSLDAALFPNLFLLRREQPGNFGTRDDLELQVWYPRFGSNDREEIWHSHLFSFSPAPTHASVFCQIALPPESLGPLEERREQIFQGSNESKARELLYLEQDAAALLVEHTLTSLDNLVTLAVNDEEHSS